MSLTPDHQNNASTSEDQLIEDVALWLVKMSSDDCSDADRQAFKEWQRHDPKRIALTQELQQTLAHFNHLQMECSSTNKQILQNTITETNQYHWIKYSLVLFFCTGLISAWLAWQMLPVNQWMADTRNSYNTWAEHTLSDQSDIKISGKTAYDLEFDQQQRLIKLYNGNVLVDVAKDATRPFIIETEYAQITALGTRFIVQHYPDATILIMLESKTQVQLKQENQTPIEVSAGQQIIINHQGVISSAKITPELLEAAWQKHMLVINKMPLDQVLGLLQSYQNQTLVYDAKALKHIGVNATLPLDHSALNLLENSLPIKVEPTFFGRIKISVDMQKEQSKAP